MTTTRPRDLERELNEWDGTWPAAWKPQEGQTLIGVVKLYSSGQSTYGEVRTVIVERADGSRVSVWLSSRVLLACFQREKPKVGDRLGLRYLGKHPEKKYRRYTLIVDRPEAEPSFEPLGGEVGDEPAPVTTPPRSAPRNTDRGGPYCAAVLRSPGGLSGSPPFPDDDDPFTDF